MQKFSASHLHILTKRVQNMRADSLIFIYFTTLLNSNGFGARFYFTSGNKTITKKRKQTEVKIT